MLVSPEQDPRPHRAEVTGVPPFHTPKGSSSYSEDHHHHTGLAIALCGGGRLSRRAQVFPRPGVLIFPLPLACVQRVVLLASSLPS